MDIRKPKTIEDFPKFIVTAVRRGETSESGYTDFELDGRFDRAIEGIKSHSFWLLIGTNDCLCASVESLDDDTHAAVLTCMEKEAPNVAGQTLFYLSQYWQAFNVWMVLDPDWGWKRTHVKGRDAIAQDYDAADISLVNGIEVRIWTKLEPADRRGHESRHYPADNQNSPPDLGPRTVPGGWGHEHCTLCRAHIDAGGIGYRDPGERWMCERCYERYVTPRDLAFVDEL